MSGENQQQTVEQQEPTAADFINDDPPEADYQPGDNAAVEGDEAAAAPEQAQAEAAEVDDDPAPEFWGANSKELWSKLKDQPELRAALKEMDAKSRRAVAQKFEDAALKQKEAEAAKTKYDGDLGHVVQWFEQNGPGIVQTIQGRWAGMTQDRWLQLARDNPAQHAELREMYNADMQRASQVAAQHQNARTQWAKSQADKLAADKAASHAKLAEELPAEFGPTKAEATYKALSQYALDQGVPAERIGNIYEPFVVKTLLKAYKYDQLQAKMKAGGTQPANGQQNATATPRRIQPGASANGGANRQSDEVRQAMEALRSGERSSAKMAAAFR